MGLKTPEINGARQELPCLESPEVNGARQAIAAVNKYVDGAWQKIWPLALDCVFHHVRLNNDASTYAYEISEDGSTLSYSITNEKTASIATALFFKIKRYGGFGTEIKIKYTLTQTVTAKNSSVGFGDMSQQLLNRDSTTFYNLYSCENETFEDTVLVDAKQDCIYLILDAHSSYDAVGTIKDIYINDEKVTFIE